MSFSDYQAHAAPIYKDLGILQFKDLVFVQTTIFMYDFHNNLLPASFSDYFKKISDCHNYFITHSILNYCLPPVSTNYGKFSLKFSGTSIWNNIDISLKSLGKKLFIKKIK